MATTKAEALKRLNAEDDASIAAMRKAIEKALERYDGTNAVTVTPIGSQKAINAVAEEYRKAGWTVEHGSEQRDGAWMTLK